MKRRVTIDLSSTDNEGSSVLRDEEEPSLTLSMVYRQ